MSEASDIAALTAELAHLRARLEEQAVELAALRAGPAPSPAPQRRLSRRHLLTGLAGLGAAGVAGVAGATPAAAADGDPLTLGEDNTASTTTRLTTTLGGAEGWELATELSSDAYATLGVGVIEDPNGNGGQVAIWADSSQSPNFGAAGVRSSAADGFAVEGWNDSTGFPTVAGINQGVGPGLGGASYGGGAQLYLAPEQDAVAGPPPSGEIGYIRLDAAGDLWVCTASGTPGAWTRLLREDHVDTAPGRVIPIAPIRALDTRATGGRASGAPTIPGQVKGPLRGGQTVTLALAGSATIPSTATGIVGNAVVITPSATGFLRVLPAGATSPASSFDFTAGSNVANGFTSALSPSGLAAVAPTASSTRYHLVIDIAAYIT